MRNDADEIAEIDFYSDYESDDHENDDYELDIDDLSEEKTMLD